jgi:hypothetical protein
MLDDGWSVMPERAQIPGLLVAHRILGHGFAPRRELVRYARLLDRKRERPADRPNNDLPFWRRRRATNRRRRSGSRSRHNPIKERDRITIKKHDHSHASVLLLGLSSIDALWALTSAQLRALLWVPSATAHVTKGCTTLWIAPVDGARQNSQEVEFLRLFNEKSPLRLHRNRIRQCLSQSSSGDCS